MIPIQLAGLAIAGSSLLSQYTQDNKSTPDNIKRNTGIFPPFPIQLPPIGYKRDTGTQMQNPIETFIKGLNSTITEISKRFVGEDYNAVVKDFIPGGTTLLKPSFSGNSREILLADLDGDLRDELIASYREDREIKTIVLKKQDNNWYKAAELAHRDYDSLHFRGTAAFTNEQGRQLLLGMAPKDKPPALIAYSFRNDSLNKLFTRDYHRFDLIPVLSEHRNAPAKSYLGVWNKKDGIIPFDINLMRWNGTELEKYDNIKPYYRQRVVPYFAYQTKNSPMHVKNWYNLADALVTADMRNDALIAIRAGMAMKPDEALREKFDALKATIS